MNGKPTPAMFGKGCDRKKAAADAESRAKAIDAAASALLNKIAYAS